MKSIIFTLLVIICFNNVFGGDVVINSQAKRKFHALIISHAQACSLEQNTKMGDLLKFVTDPDATTPKKKCLLACIMTKLGVMDSKNNLVISKMEKMAHELTSGNAKVIRATVEIGQECSQHYNTDKCEAAYKYETCIINGFKQRNLKFNHGL